MTSLAEHNSSAKIAKETLLEFQEFPLDIINLISSYIKITPYITIRICGIDCYILDNLYSSIDINNALTVEEAWQSRLLRNAIHYPKKLVIINDIQHIDHYIFLKCIKYMKIKSSYLKYDFIDKLYKKGHLDNMLKYSLRLQIADLLDNIRAYIRNSEEPIKWNYTSETSIAYMPIKEIIHLHWKK